MSSAPRWRYVSRPVPVIEKVIGLVTLLALVALAGLFARDVRRPALSPFTVDPELLAQVAQPAEAVAAAYLLPAGAGLAVQRSEAPQVVRAEQLVQINPALAQTLGQYRVKRLALAGYRAAVGGGAQDGAEPARAAEWHAAVIELAGPERAFELWSALRPADAKTLNIGGGDNGWQSGASGAFWAGRYYVEVWPKTATAAQSAGEPAGASEAAAALLGELGRAHVFQAGPLPTEAVEPQQGPRADSARFKTEPAARAKTTDGPLPALEEADLRGPLEVRRFHADTLYEKIDGKAQLYLSYGFVELLFTTYAAGEGSFDVYAYNMGNPDNAFGIFKAEQGPEPELAPVGSEGYLSGSSVFFWKGKYYVNVLAGAPGGDAHEADSGDTAGRPTAVKLAAAIAAGIPAAEQSLWAERVLPEDNRVEGSFEYIKSDAFGLDFLRDVYAAKYRVAGRELTLFVMRLESPAKAQEVLKQYDAFTGKYGKVLDRGEAGSAQVLATETMGAHDVVFAADRYFGGVTTAEDIQAARKVVADWLAGLNAGAPNAKASD